MWYPPGMADFDRAVDVSFTEEKHPSRLDEEMGSRAANVASIFASEPAALEVVIEQANKRFGYGQNMVRQCLAWLDERGMARGKLRDGTVYWGRPIDVKKLVDLAASVTEVMAGSIDAMGGEKAAKVMRDAATVARAVPVAVEGIKREAKPVVDAFTKLGAAAKEAGFFRLREPLDIQPPAKREAK